MEMGLAEVIGLRRGHTVKVGPHLMTESLEEGRNLDTDTGDTGKMPCKDGVRGWRDVATGQGYLEPPEAGRGRQLWWSLGGARTLIGLAASRTMKEYISAVLSPPGLWCFVTLPTLTCTSIQNTILCHPVITPLRNVKGPAKNYQNQY